MEKKIIQEIVILRPLLIFCIVVGHSFSYYKVAIAPIEVYNWVNPFFISFQLAAFVFISGYLFGISSLAGFKSSVLGYIGDKFKRLYLPALIFGVVYFFLFDFKGSLREFISPELFYKFLNGYSHLWFLPMLFLCYTFHRIFYKIEIKHLRITVIILLIACFAATLIPVTHKAIQSFMYHNICFFLGVLSYKYRLFEKSNKILYPISAIGLFIILFLVYHNLSNSDSVIVRGTVFITTLAAYVSAIYGFFKLTSLLLIKDKDYNYGILKKLNKLSFSIYVIHQFVLIFIIKFTNLDETISSLQYPFALLAITTIASLLIADANKELLR